VSSFIAGVHAEFTKLLTTRMWWLLAIILFVYIALIAGGLGALFGGVGSDALGGGRPGAPAPGGRGPRILSTTGEFRHQTLTPTFLANPRRGQVLGAKSLSTVLLGAFYGVVALAASVGVGAIVLSAFGQNAMLGEGSTWALIARAVLAMALWALIGVGLGTLVPNQVATIVIVLAFTQFVEPLLRLATSFSEPTAAVGKFLPGSASDALVGASFFTISTPGAGVLEWWQGGLVLLAYAAAFTVGGYFVSWRRDVT
jgi:hypothetical protein